MNNIPAESELEDRPKSPPRFTYASGTRPLDGYTIKRGVGRGGFGEVYYALSDAGKEVALKLIRRNLEIELRGVTHCLNLKHPNLVALYDIRTDEHDDRWVVMEYVSGESLEDAIARHPDGMPLDEVLRWFSGMAAGVAYLHEHGIVHRDLKPANIFLDEGTVKIGDYGLSKFISCSRRSGQTESVGTVHYMAPEIANGRYGREIDTYALGIILYEMLTGHVPFEGESVGEVLMKHLTAEPDLSALSEPYRSVVKGAMTKDPELRISNVAEMVRELDLPHPAMPIGATYASKQAPHGRHSPSFGDPLSDGSDSNEPIILTPVEPLWAWTESQCHHLRSQFDQQSPLVKGLIMFAGVASAIFVLPRLIPTLFFAAFVYLVYWSIWSLTVKPTLVSRAPQVSSPPPRRNNERGSGEPRKKPRLFRQSWQERVRQHVAAKPLRSRLFELVGSMFLAGLTASVATLLVCLITMQPMQVDFCVWLTIVATLACWAILIPGKLLEGRLEDQSPMRCIQFVSGAAVGVAAWASAQSMFVPVFSFSGMGVGPRDSLMANALGFRVNAGGSSTSVGDMPVQVFAAYFAFLFVLLAWWRQADSSRTTRVSVWTILWCGLVAWLLHFVFWFPQPVGMMLAALMAFSIQLSSPWLSPSKRRELLDTAGAG